MKNFVLALVLAAALATVPGCSSPGKINADSIDELVTDVTGRHDTYVKADPAYDDPASEKFGRRDSDLRSAELLRKVLAEAKAAKTPPPPSPPATGTSAKCPGGMIDPCDQGEFETPPRMKETPK